MPSDKKAERLAQLAHVRATVVADGAGGKSESKQESGVSAASSSSSRLWNAWSEAEGFVTDVPPGRWPYGGDRWLTKVAAGHLEPAPPPLRKLPSGAEAKRLREYLQLMVEVVAPRLHTTPDDLLAFEDTGVIPTYVSRNIYSPDEPILGETIESALLQRYLSACQVIYTARGGASWSEPVPEARLTGHRPEPTVLYREAYDESLLQRMEKIARGDVLCPVLTGVPLAESLLRLYKVAYQWTYPPGTARRNGPRHAAEMGLAHLLGGEHYLDWFHQLHGYGEDDAPVVDPPMALLRVLGVLTCWAESQTEEA